MLVTALLTETGDLTLLTVNFSLLTAHYTLVLTTHWYLSLNSAPSPPLKHAGYCCMSSSVWCALKFRVCSSVCSVDCSVQCAGLAGGTLSLPGALPVVSAGPVVWFGPGRGL